MRRIAWALPALLAGCVSIARPEKLPDGFVPVERGEYSWRAMSADGIVLGLRTRPREPKEGTLEFWSAVARKELEGRGTYTLKSEEPVASKRLAGSGMLFVVSGEQAYFLALFVSDARIHTLEAAGPIEAVDQALPRTKAFLGGLELP